MKIRMMLKDSKTLMDSINLWKQKIKDAEFDLTQKGVASIANSLMEKKDEIASTTSFAGLRDLVREQVGKFDTPKSREILAKVDELDRMYQRDPRPGGRNDYWVWDKLLKYVYNILLKASGSPSPDVKEKKEDSACVKDVIVHADYNYNEPGDFWVCRVEEDLDANDMFGPDRSKAHVFPSAEEAKRFCEENGIDDYDLQDSVKDSAEHEERIKELAKLLGEAHDKLIEANDIASDLESDDRIESDLLYAIEDLEAAASELDFMGEDDPTAALKEKYGVDEDIDWDEAEDIDVE